MKAPSVSAKLDQAYLAYQANPSVNEEALYEAIYTFTKKHYTGIRDEDAIQEAIVKLWQDIPVFRGGKSKFSAWATKVIGNGLQYEMRKQRLRESHEVSLDTLLENGNESFLGESKVLSPEETRMVEEAVGSLTPKQRRVVSLLKEGHTESGVARALGISPATVHEHWEAALKKLRKGRR